MPVSVHLAQEDELNWACPLAYGGVRVASDALAFEL